jgi:hypothetical protein
MSAYVKRKSLSSSGKKAMVLFWRNKLVMKL